ncbi:hypothetical protein GCM10009799_06140 [Nocardiopsis rhodophaea]|uniref:DUF4352 domain-containing protein n=1 Tax=Nocardiopsis rhodophaea TaxID=280238 RepID=A0ABN2SBY3_9ACTN
MHGQHMPPEPKKSKAWLWGCLGCGGAALVLLLVGGGCMAILGNSAEEVLKDGSSNSAPSGGDGGSDEAAEDGPVKIEAESTEFTPSVLHNGGDFTSVKVTVSNNGDENVDVNAAYFSITDTDGTKHDATKGMIEDENAIESVTLAPDENVSGVITGEGSFTPASVTFDIPFGETIKVDVN